VTTPVVPTSAADPFDEGVLADPYPMHEELRELGPVVLLERYAVWAMARHERAHAALADPTTSCSSAGVGLSDFRKEKPWRPPSLLLEADPPAHTRARRPVTRAMSPGTIRRLHDLLADAARVLFDRLAGRTRIDGIAELARRCDKISVDGPLVRQLSNTLRGLDSLPLAVSPSGSG
jgi:4-methoxybenzoate monooxygenase (O-demethylating)